MEKATLAPQPIREALESIKAGPRAWYITVASRNANF